MNYKINDKVYVDMNEFFPYIREITGNDYISTGIIRNERKNEFYHEYLIEWKNQATGTYALQHMCLWLDNVPRDKHPMSYFDIKQLRKNLSM